MNNNQGVITIYGKVQFGRGCIVTLCNSELILSDDVKIGHNSKVLCRSKITIGKGTRFSWQCQIMDTDFHQVRNMDTGETFPVSKPIRIGKRTWVANNVSIMKGVTLPDHTIVGGNSIVRPLKNEIPEYSLLAGSPAILKKTRIERVDW